jgi:hypothetical protein
MNSIKAAARTTTLISLECLRNYRGILQRVGLVILFAAAAHQVTWQWLRFLTSELVFRLSGFLDIRATRVSFDLIELQGEQFRYLTSCTFVDVFIASIPLVWNVKASIVRNAAWVAVAGMALFTFNAVRLEMAILLHFNGIPWTIADGVLGGCSYFIVWLVIWYTRSWCLEVPLERMHAALS